MLYEFPFNERIRTYLRLEHLLRRLSVLVPREQPLDHHYALATMFEIIDVSARPDLKTDLLKDLERQKQILNAYRDNPHISQATLDDIIGQLEGCFTALHEQTGKAGQELLEHDWLSTLRSRFAIPGGTCEFDLPVYHAWQHLPPRAALPISSAGRSRWPPWPSPSTCCCACCATPAAGRKWQRSAAFSSRIYPRVAPFSCCGCVWIRTPIWCRK